MYLPHRRVGYRNALDEHVLATIGLYKLWPEVLTFSKDSLCDRHSIFGHLFQSLPGFLLVRIALFPAGVCVALPRPPVLFTRLAVKSSLTGDGDVPLLEGIDEWRIVHQFHALPTREHKRQILTWVLVEFDCRPAADV